MTPRWSHPNDPAAVVVIRWLARAASLASIGLLVAFATSGGNWPTALEWALIACFPLGTVAGMAIAWWKEIAGGLVTLASLALFYAIATVAGGGPPTGPWFVAFAAPGLALLGCGIASRVNGGGGATLPRAAVPEQIAELTAGEHRNRPARADNDR